MRPSDRRERSLVRIRRLPDLTKVVGEFERFLSPRFKALVVEGLPKDRAFPREIYPKAVVMAAELVARSGISEAVKAEASALFEDALRQHEQGHRVEAESRKGGGSDASPAPRDIAGRGTGAAHN